jgi:hypothetical protein
MTYRPGDLLPMSHVTRHTSHVTLAGDPMPQHGSISCDFVGATRLRHPQPANLEHPNTAECPLPAADGSLGLSFALAQTVRYAFLAVMWLKDADDHESQTLNPFPSSIQLRIFSHMLTTQVLQSSIKFMSCLSVQKQVDSIFSASSAASVAHFAMLFVAY